MQRLMQRRTAYYSKATPSNACTHVAYLGDIEVALMLQVLDAVLRQALVEGQAHLHVVPAL